MPATELELDFRFSTDDLPEPERRAAVGDLFRRVLWAADYEPLAETPVYIDGRFRALPGLGLADVTCSGAGGPAARTRTSMTIICSASCCAAPRRSGSADARQQSVMAKPF